MNRNRRPRRLSPRSSYRHRHATPLSHREIIEARKALTPRPVSLRPHHVIIATVAAASPSSPPPPANHASVPPPPRHHSLTDNARKRADKNGAHRNCLIPPVDRYGKSERTIVRERHGLVNRRTSQPAARSPQIDRRPLLPPPGGGGTFETRRLERDRRRGSGEG